MAEFNYLFDLLPYAREKYNLPDQLAYKREGRWITYSHDDFIRITDHLGFGLLAEGLQPGDKVAISSMNRPEWNFVDMACVKLGLIVVPLYPTASLKDYEFILNDAEVKVIFVENEDILAKVQQVKERCPQLKKIYSFNQISQVPHWEDCLRKGEQNPQPERQKEIQAQIKPDDLFTIIYTSGTTGVPKGVMLTHKNIVTNVRSASKIFPEGKTAGTRALSFLPLCHVFERMVTFAYMYLGIAIYYAESMDKIGDNLKEVKPHYFTTVPRLLEKVYDKIVAKGNELTGIKKKLFFWALNLGLRYELHNANGFWYALQLALARKLIFSKWREALGGNVQFIFSGAAALQPRLARVFTAAGITVLEGYGLSETSPVVSANRIEEENRMFGTVGIPIDDVEVKIDTSDGEYRPGEGEICVKGPNVMAGYYKRPDLTTEVIDKDGWFHTGDVGMIINGRFLKITDRKKEVFKTSGGKFIAPQPMENKFKESIYIEQIMVLGENRKFPSALIVPSWDALKKWAESKGISYSSNKELIDHPAVRALYQNEVEKYNQEFGSWEQIKKFELIPHEWSVDGGELTPTLKLRRKPIQEKYADLIERMYAE
ncbi:MAG: long-chain fatty acid--CoA ligase [Flavobacteriales bacterium]|nr:long-chain fatty acid--CoA ligase [Flavobacteriales bacterium]MDW8410818.1 long-chain fatty acid--CoA ligase [Flavobacteriales bacterium]